MLRFLKFGENMSPKIYMYVDMITHTKISSFRGDVENITDDDGRMVIAISRSLVAWGR